MNISSDIFTTDGPNSSSYSLHNGTGVEDDFSGIPELYLFSALLGFLINSYVVWLIMTGTGNGFAAEFFGLNLAVCEIFICMQYVFIFLSYDFGILWIVVDFLDAFSMTGRPLFQCLICVERYLAVVHPVTFLKYKPLRYRVICSVIVFVAIFVSGGVNIMFFMLQSIWSFLVSFFAQFLVFLSIQLFCCLAVLRALKQSGPGEKGRERREENHMKKRAFYHILICTVTMLILYIPYLILVAYFWSLETETGNLIVSVSFILAGLVQPLFFLYRAGKLSFKQI